MPITTGAKKANRASLRKRVFNIRRNRELNEVVKNMRKHIVSGETKEAEAMMPAAQKAIDKAQKRGIIKKHTADRKKSRLVAAIQRSKK